MKVAVIGASGLLGRAIVKELKNDPELEIITTAFKRTSIQDISLDLRIKTAIEAFIHQYKPDFIIYTAAEKSPDICEKEPLLAKAINVDALEAVALAAKKWNAWVVYFSTDYVFDGCNPPYQAYDQPNPLNAYGLSKWQGEQILQRISNNCMIVRLPILYGSTQDLRESAVTVIAHSLLNAKGEKVYMDDVAIRYPTHTADIALLCRRILHYKMIHTSFQGIFHYSANEPYTKYQMAQVIAGILNIEPDVIVAQQQTTSFVKRPHDCHLATTSLEDFAIGKYQSFKQGIAQVIKAIPI